MTTKHNSHNPETELPFPNKGTINNWLTVGMIDAYIMIVKQPPANQLNKHDTTRYKIYLTYPGLGIKSNYIGFYYQTPYNNWKIKYFGNRNLKLTSFVRAGNKEGINSFIHTHIANLLALNSCQTYRAEPYTLTTFREQELIEEAS